MKRILVTILSVLYMASATGATVHLHYCMGQFIGASLSHDDEGKCSHCGMNKGARKKGCCKDEHKVIKNSAQHLQAKVISQVSAKHFAAEIVPSSTYYNEAITGREINIMALSHAPPSAWRTCPIYVCNRNFRI